MAYQISVDVDGFNNSDSSLIFGHPRAPTAGRLIIEEVAMAGGCLLFSGRGASDTGAAVVLKIGNRRSFSGSTFRVGCV